MNSTVWNSGDDRFLWAPYVEDTLGRQRFAMFFPRASPVFALGPTSPLRGKFVAPLNEKDKPLNEKYKSRGTLWAPCARDTVVP